MAPEDDTEKRRRRRLVKKKKPQRQTSVHFPERLRYGEDKNDDVTAANGKTVQYMNQSVFSMIAAAGSKTNFHARFEDESSDSEEDGEAAVDAGGDGQKALKTPPLDYARHQQEQTKDPKRVAEKDREDADHMHTASSPKLSTETGEERSDFVQSSYLPYAQQSLSLGSPKQMTPRDAPVMSQRLAAQAQLGLSTELLREHEDSGSLKAPSSPKSRDSLAKRLMEIFDFERPEEVVSGVLPTDCPNGKGVLIFARISLLAYAECSASRVHVYHTSPHLLLCLLAQEICKS